MYIIRAYHKNIEFILKIYLLNSITVLKSIQFLVIIDRPFFMIYEIFV